MRKKMPIICGLLLLAAGVGLLCRTWRWDSPFPYTLRARVAASWPDEGQWQVMGGVWSSPMLRLTARLNTEAFIGDLKGALPDHPVVATWTTANTSFRPYLLAPGGPLCIDISAPVYGHGRWSLLTQGADVDRTRTDRLEADVQRALQELVLPGNPGTPGTGRSNGP